MSIWEAILLGIIQGLTEFIPISSTAHLTIAGKLLGLVNPERPDQWTAFIAVIQLGTLIAVLIYFRGDIFKIIRGFTLAHLNRLKRRETDRPTKDAALLGWMVIIGTIPVGIVGLAFRDIIEGDLTKSLWVISASLIGLAGLLALAELIGKDERDMSRLRLADAVVVGVAQVFALIPGSSRSGTTITAGLMVGLKRETAARFSFLLSIPAITASGLLELPKALSTVEVGWTNLFVATLVSAVSGYAAIAFLINYLRRHTTFLFVWYRIALGLILIALVRIGVVD